MIRDIPEKSMAINIWPNCDLKFEPTVLEFHNLTYIANGLKKHTKRILQYVTGRFESGKLVAVLGPLDSGKSSLLEVLSKSR